MTDTIAAAREVLAGVRERYPAPLAAPAAELLFELSAARPNHMRCFLLEIDLFEISVAFFGFIQVAQLHRSGAPPRASEGAVLQLRDNPALCTGHWWGLLREASRDVHALPQGSAAAVAHELAGLYFDPAGRSSRLGKVLDQVPGLRNRVKGHAWTLPDEQYEAHARDLLGAVVSYLSTLEFLERHLLVQCLTCEAADAAHALDLALLAGDARRPRRQHVAAAGPLEPGRLYLVRRDDLAAGRPDVGAFLGLHPFVQFRARDGRPPALYLMQSLRDGEAELRAAVGGEAFADPASGREARDMLDALLSRSAASVGPFGRMREAVAAADREALASPQGRASYRAETYLARPRLLRQVEEFVAAGRGAALLAAPSGMGKTALACHLADRWLLSADETEAVLVVFAQEPAAAGESLDQWARRRLGFSLAELRDGAAQAGARVLLVVDGLERGRDRRAILDEAAALTAGGGPLRFVFTLTQSVLPDVLRGAAAAGGAPHLMAVPPLSAAEGRKLYEIFQGNCGGGVRPPDAMLVALRTPLLIRLAQASAGAGEDVSASQVLLAYTEQVIYSDLARSELVGRLADWMIDAGVRSVPVADLSGDPWMRSALLSDAPDGPLQGLVRDGVLFLEWAPPGGRLPLPAEAHVGFTFDQLRDFVVFARLCRRRGVDSSAMAQLASAAGPSSPLIGGFRVLVLEQLREAAPDKPPDEALDLLHRLGGPSREALLRELFLAPTGPRLGPALAGLLGALYGRIGPDERKGFLEAARQAFDHLERGGRSEEAAGLCALVRDLGLAAHPEQVLPLLCAWSRFQLRNVGAAEALETARFARESAAALPDRSFRAEATACAADAIFASGSRPEAEEVLRPEIEAGVEGLSKEARFAVCLAATRVLLRSHEAARARETVRRLARESKRPRWLALACFAELGPLLADSEREVTEPLVRLAEECLGHARQSGCAWLEAEACRYAAWCWRWDSARELTFIEAGLEAADAGSDLAGRAQLLRRQATWFLKVGRPRDAEAPAAEAAAVFDRFGFRERALQLRQHVLMTIEWELGRPGKGLALLRGNLDGFRAIGREGEAALSAMLIAELLGDVGDAAAARQMLAESQRIARAKALNYDLVGGRVLQLEGDLDGALDSFGRARAWGVRTRFSDFVYQPGLLAVRLLLERADPARNDRERADALLQELLEDQTVDARHRERYEGELYALFARLHAERGGLEQAEVWLSKADEWFARNPTHRGVPEWKATRLLLQWLTADRQERAPGGAAEASAKSKGRDEQVVALKRAQGIKAGIRKRIPAEVLALVRATADTFDDPREAEGYYAHHPVHVVLRRAQGEEGGAGSGEKRDNRGGYNPI